MTDDREALDAIGAAADELIPQLAERLRIHALGEIEVSSDDLRVRVTAPSDGNGTTSASRPELMTETAASVPGRSAIAPDIGPPAGPGSVGVSSPAVGFFVYADGLGPGLEVAKGDPLGHVEMLGVRHDVRAPRGGIVRHLVAESGEAVEYGQVVMELEPAGSPS